MANLVSCSQLQAAIISAVEAMSEEDRARLAELLNVNLENLVSAVEDNLLKVSIDGKLSVEAKDLVSGEIGNVIQIIDGKLYVKEVKPAGLISKDADNALVVGTDTLLYVPALTSNLVQLFENSLYY